VGVQVHTTVEAIEKRGDDLIVHIRAGNKTREVVADLAVCRRERVLPRDSPLGSRFEAKRRASDGPLPFQNPKYRVD